MTDGAKVELDPAYRDAVSMAAHRLDEIGLAQGVDATLVQPIGGGRFAILRVVGADEAARVDAIRKRVIPPHPNPRRILGARVRLLIAIKGGRHLTPDNARAWLRSDWHVTADEAAIAVEQLLERGALEISEENCLVIVEPKPLFGPA
jgi:hypothetical protein